MTDEKPEKTAIAKVLTKAAKQQQVLTWILEGNSEHDILEAINAQWPNEKAKPLIVNALDELAKSGTVDKTAVAGWCFEATRFVYGKMIEQGDYTGALRAIKQLKEISQK